MVFKHDDYINHHSAKQAKTCPVVAQSVVDAFQTTAVYN